MKTTIELPDDLFREAKATAAREGTLLKDLVREAVEDRLARGSARADANGSPAWPIAPPNVPPAELDRISKYIDEAFEQIDSEDNS
jgi:hypothetical protein